jgi:hypothetical protein
MASRCADGSATLTCMMLSGFRPDLGRLSEALHAAADRTSSRPRVDDRLEGLADP